MTSHGATVKFAYGTNRRTSSQGGATVLRLHRQAQPNTSLGRGRTSVRFRPVIAPLVRIITSSPLVGQDRCRASLVHPLVHYLRHGWSETRSSYTAQSDHPETHCTEGDLRRIDSSVNSKGVTIVEVRIDEHNSWALACASDKGRELFRGGAIELKRIQRPVGGERGLRRQSSKFPQTGARSEPLVPAMDGVVAFATQSNEPESHFLIWRW